MRYLSLHRATLILAFPLTVVSCCLPSRTVGVLTRSEKPIWKVDLKEAGFTSHFGGPGAYGACRQMAFGSNDELVILSDSGGQAKPKRVHAYVLETSTGKQVGAADWMAKGWPYIYATASGGYAVITEHGTDLYSPGLKKVLASHPISVEHASPDGRALSGWSRENRPGHAITEFLDTRTLQPTGVEVLNMSVDSISRDRAANVGFAKGSHYASVFASDGKEELLVYQPRCKEVRPHFLSPAVLAIQGCGQIHVVTLDGRRLFEFEVAYETSFVAVSRDGRRFATLEGHYSWGDPPSLCAERVAVVDLERKGAIFSVTLRDMPRGDEDGSSGVALSPDGTLLAINTLGVIRLFSLP